MNPAHFVILVQALVVIACALAALVAIVAGFRLYRPARIELSVRGNRILGLALMLSSLPWFGLALQQQSHIDSAIAMLTIGDMPATAAGIAPSAYPAEPVSAATTASVATFAEELAADPRHPDFLQLRGKVTEMLYSAEHFGRYPNPVLLSVPDGRDGETIRYLAEERPGLLTVIYHSRDGEEARMLVYWPEVAGDKLIYTPLSGPSTQALSQLVEDALER